MKCQYKSKSSLVWIVVPCIGILLCSSPLHAEDSAVTVFKYSSMRPLSVNLKKSTEKSNYSLKGVSKPEERPFQIRCDTILTQAYNGYIKARYYLQFNKEKWKFTLRIINFNDFERLQYPYGILTYEDSAVDGSYGDTINTPLGFFVHFNKTNTSQAINDGVYDGHFELIFSKKLMVDGPHFECGPQPSKEEIQELQNKLDSIELIYLRKYPAQRWYIGWQSHGTRNLICGYEQCEAFINSDGTWNQYLARKFGLIRCYDYSNLHRWSYDSLRIHPEHQNMLLYLAGRRTHNYINYHFEIKDRIAALVDTAARMRNGKDIDVLFHLKIAAAGSVCSVGVKRSNLRGDDAALLFKKMIQEWQFKPMPQKNDTSEFLFNLRVEYDALKKTSP